MLYGRDREESINENRKESDRAVCHLFGSSSCLFYMAYGPQRRGWGDGNLSGNGRCKPSSGLSDYAGYEDGAVINLETLMADGVIKKEPNGLKVLGNGNITKKLTVQATVFSASAKEKIEAAGGKAEVI